MIVPPAGVRVWLATGTTDMRRYAECLIMRSSGPGGSSQAVHRAVPLRINTVLLDACRIKEDTHAEFDHASRRPDLVP
jgi:hypothetical protein